METGLLVALLVVICGGVYVLILILKGVSDLNKEVKATAGRIEKLEARVASQERALAEIRTTLSEEKHGLVNEGMALVDQFRKKGLVSGLVALGSVLYKAYFRKKRATALPAPDGKKELK